MGRKKKKAKTAANTELPPPKPKPSVDDDDDNSNYAHELLYGTNDFYDAKEKRKEERRKKMEIKKKEHEEQKKKEDTNKEEEKPKEENNKNEQQKQDEKKRKEDNNNIRRRTPHVRIPADCVSKYFELRQKLGFENDGDAIAWLMGQAQPAMDKVLAISEKQIQKNATPITNTNSTSCELDTSQLCKQIQVNQVWALWDDDTDGMPRLYARIRKLLFDEVKVEVAFLEPVPTTDEEVKWLVDKPMACGTFKQATPTTSMEILDFSHQVICGKGSSVVNSLFKISPQSGEIWAVYKDWDINWTFHDFSHCRYELVEVVSDLEDGSAVTAISLTKVSGVGDAFRRQVHGRDGLVRWQQFSGTQLLQFSHRIPASKVKVQEMDGVPVESWKLNPSAVPIQCRPSKIS